MKFRRKVKANYAHNCSRLFERALVCGRGFACGGSTINSKQFITFPLLVGLLIFSLYETFLKLLIIDEVTSWAKTCDDPQKLMPLCNRCIPGLIWDSKSDSCELSASMVALRNDLFDIASQSGIKNSCQAYNHLDNDTFRQRHAYAGKVLDEIKPERILDIGANIDPIHLYMGFCPKKITMVEPCGELSHAGNTPWLSKQILNDPCTAGRSSDKSIYNIFPKSFKELVLEPNSLQYHEAVVCIGCDINYGPTWEELMYLPRPFHLILEFSALPFHKDYPIHHSNGCTIVGAKDFDFSHCKECKFSDDNQRKMLVYHCQNRIQEYDTRLIETKKVLQKYCNSTTDSNTYRGIACDAEKILFTKAKIQDTALMAADVNTATEMKDEKRIARYRKRSQHYSGHECNGLKWMKDGRNWWDTYKNQTKLSNAKYALEKAKQCISSMNIYDLYECLCFASHARSLLSAATPQADVYVMLHESIKEYQNIFHNVLRFESQNYANDLGLSPGYRFPLKSCPPFLSKEYIDEVSDLEPILPNGRNLDFREFGCLISFNPYIPLISFDTVKSRAFGRRVLIDVGANGFSASTKQLIDNYDGHGVTFDEVIMFEPDIDGMYQGIDFYKPQTFIAFHRQYISVSTRDPESDIISFIGNNYDKDDYLVLKFDVDEGNSGPTIEWGFLGDLLYSKEIALVDELYVELHYRNRKGSPQWNYDTHSARQRYDVVRQLRTCGMAIHDWP